MKSACCNVCKKAGKPWSHFPKDSSGRTVCPTLLGEKRGFYCKVCKDSGKPESIFTAHNVKDKTGKVCCPTLLSQACSKCGNMGHTINYCNVEKGKRHKKFDEKEVRREKVVPTSGFSVLDFSDSEEEQTKAEIKLKRKLPDTLSQNVTLRPHQKAPIFTEKQVGMMRSFRNGTLNWADIDSDEDD